MSSVGKYLERIIYSLLNGILLQTIRKDLGQYRHKKYVAQHT
jgi:hypothetical protein